MSKYYWLNPKAKAGTAQYFPQGIEPNEKGEVMVSSVNGESRQIKSRMVKRDSISNTEICHAEEVVVNGELGGYLVYSLSEDGGISPMSSIVSPWFWR